ncbi:MAG: hypothetical protein FJW23_00185 [Acidimicrobiia bacterium]|nr:hypothetical protein [Acidimicrobiia bacterium]
MNAGADAIRQEALERRAVKKTTVAARRAYTGARGAALRERDEPRLRLAQAAAAPGGLGIPGDRGLLRVGPAELADLTTGLLADANALIDGIGHEGLRSKSGEKSFIARGFLPPSAFERQSPYMRFALDPRIVHPIAAYLGVVPVLTEIDIWYSAHHPKAPKSSQLWHLDNADTSQVKVWVHLGDVDERSGPLTLLDATTSDVLAEAAGYDFAEGYRVPDDRVAELVGAGRAVALVGPAGTVDFTDTSRCFHFGSRVAEDGRPRRLLMLQYLTPYAFDFADHRKEAAYRALATADAPEIERLVLGAD